MRGFTCTQPNVILSLAELPNMVLMSPFLLAIVRVVAKTMRTPPRRARRAGAEHTVLRGQLAPAVLVVEVRGNDVEHGTRDQRPGDLGFAWLLRRLWAPVYHRAW